MDKLTLEHLSPYLPYGLKAEMLDYKSDYVGKQYDEIVGFHQWDKNCLYWSTLTIGGSKPNIERIKPILRPLSDLTKEIEHNGERFVPKNRIDQYTQVGGDGKLYLLVDGAHWSCNPLSWDYSTVLKLISWHFDVFGLIGKGLAIDLNTLKLKNNG